MADTRRVLTALQTLLADNTSGQISPQDVRDAVASCYPDAINVLNEGVKNDGSEQGALIRAAAAKLPTGGGLYFPAGRYGFSADLITLVSRLHVFGDGASSILDPLASGARAFKIIADNVQKWSIQNLAVESSVNFGTLLDLFATPNNSHSLWAMRNVWGLNLQKGIVGSTDDTKGGNGFSLDHVHLRLTSGVGVDLQSSVYGAFNADALQITNGGTYGLVYGGRQLGATFSMADIESNTTADVRLLSAANVTFLGGHFESPNAQPLIQIYNDGAGGDGCDTIAFLGGGFGGNGAPAAWVEIGDTTFNGGKGLLFACNRFTGGASAGIRCRTPRNDPSALVLTPYRITVPALLDAASTTSAVVDVMERIGAHRVVATGSLPAAGASMDGNVLIEDAGAGDRNLIVYAGTQRFRIDGGASF